MSDRYTKIVLTVIATALCLDVAMRAIPQAEAQVEKAIPVVLVDWQGQYLSTVPGISPSLAVTVKE